MTESDNRNVVWLKKVKTGMTDHESTEISLTSRDDSVEELIKKAKEAIQ